MKNQEIEIYASRLKQFDFFELPSKNIYKNDNIFIIVSGSGYFNWREIRGKLQSVTSHYMSEKLNTNLALYAPTVVENHIYIITT